MKEVNIIARNQQRYDIMTDSRTTAQDIQMQKAWVELQKVEDDIKTRNEEMLKVDQDLVVLRSEIQELRKKGEAVQQSTEQPAAAKAGRERGEREKAAAKVAEDRLRAEEEERIANQEAEEKAQKDREAA